MRTPSHKSKTAQLDLVDLEPLSNACGHGAEAESRSDRLVNVEQLWSPAARNRAGEGRAMQLAIHLLREDAGNPRTEFPDAELDELAEDIKEHGVLQPIVVHAADAEGRYLIHFGSKRLRAARQAGLTHLPVVVRDLPADAYAQVAENQKRHGLSALDLARFIRSRVDGGDSNATIAKRLGMNLTSVAHHLALLELPPELDQALKSGRCISPRTLHELSKLREEQPDKVKELVAGEAEITRTTVTAMRADPAPSSSAAPGSSRAATLLLQAHASCTRLERALARLRSAQHDVGEDGLAVLRQRITDLAVRLGKGSDRQTS
jgi:ParB family transcriptional regulator, chromosome partitioning protein